MRNCPDTVMFFCAGRGTRMGALTQHQPKPMVQVGQKPLIDHALGQMQNVERGFANVHYCPDKLTDRLKAAGLKTIFEPELLETGGGLKGILTDIDRDSVYTMNTDAVWIGPQAGAFLGQKWDPETMDALLLTVPQSRAHAHKGTGDFVADPSGRLQRGAGDIYTGLQIVKTKFVKDVTAKVFSMNAVWETLLERQTMFGVNYSGHWCDVGYPEAIPIAETLLEG